ncbi:MAG: CoA transferase [Elusimicrobia bacterium]|nr:CoA transferase [Elusimicrobiota bacterium]
MKKTPLKGVTVLDMTRLLPGPYATMLLADLGARVIHVAMPKMLDPLLHWLHRGASKKFISRSLYRGKESAAINFKRPSGRELILKLGRRADVFVEGYRPGALEKIGLGYRDLFRVNPRIIYCSISGYGQQGPRRRWASHDINYLALSGFLSFMNDHGRPPAPLPIQLGDLIGGSYASVVSILAALWERQRSGRGQYVDVSMLHGLMSAMVMPFAEMLQGRSFGRGGMALTGQDPMYRTYATADGRYLAVGAVESSSNHRLLELLGRPQLISGLEDPAQWPRIGLQLEDLFRTKTLRQWRRLLENQEVCMSPVLTLKEALREGRVASGGLVHGSILPRQAWLGSPFRFSRSGVGSEQGRDLEIGAQTLKALGSMGISRTELTALRKQKVII